MLDFIVTRKIINVEAGLSEFQKLFMYRIYPEIQKLFSKYGDMAILGYIAPGSSEVSLYARFIKEGDYELGVSIDKYGEYKVQPFYGREEKCLDFKRKIEDLQNFLKSIEGIK